MKFSFKKCGIVACIAGVLLLAWINLRPVELVAVHQHDEFAYILVRNFPLTDRGKIAWWLAHADELKAKYGFPRPGLYGLYSISFWDFDDGYKEDAYDLLCFSDMKTKKNCIEKNVVFRVDNARDGTVIFTTDNDAYTLKNGKIVPYKI
ncbi:MULTISPECIES: DUF943 family protein [unclassified Pseudescherichia]|jgi:hypothetical protein|uniref:DUF943 family protein n=1 Tax=unclassified Pseudescherichia TaxID=2620545 RepID=UPI00214FECFE|nr:MULTISPECIES: DUF943 family protein [unclassified Pseudescherichia]MCR4459780.1 DUF943 family protein [Pseudescherichia sp. L3]